MTKQDPNSGQFDQFETYNWGVYKDRFVVYTGINEDAITDLKELKRLRKALDKLIQRKENEE